MEEGAAVAGPEEMAAAEETAVGVAAEVAAVGATK
tara:strand:- start:415 stop:519 length:105 start_codon:yes stop_codon:yes gene_type:complete